MSAMVKDHCEDLSEFKREAKDAKSIKVKDAAEQGSQVIQQHLQLAEQVPSAATKLTQPEPGTRAHPPDPSKSGNEKPTTTALS